MSTTDFRETLRVVNTVLALVGSHPATRSAILRRRLRVLALERDLLRIRLRQPPTSLRRN